MPNEQVRILFIYLAAFPVYEGFVSGGERHFLEVARRWQSWGCHLEVLTTPTGAQILRENGIRAPVHVVSIPLEKGLARSNIGLAVLYFLRGLAALPKLRRLRRDFRLICAVSHYLADTLPAASAGKLCPGAQVAVYLHHLEPPFRRRSRYQPWLASLFSSLNSAASVFLVRRWAHRVLTFPTFGEALIQRGIPAQRLFFTANAVDWDGISRATSAAKEYQACFMGRIAPLKGMDDLVEVWKRVCQELPGARLVGIDVSAPGLSLSRELTEGYHGSFQGVLAEATNLPFANSTFGTVICYKTLECIYQPQQALAEMSRVLRPGGSLFLCTLNRHFLFRTLYRLFHPRHLREPFLPLAYFDLPQLQARLREVRLEVEAYAYPWSFVSAAWDVWMLPRLVTRALKSRHASIWLKLLRWLRLPLMALAWLDRFFRLAHQSSVIVVVGRKMAA